MASQNNNFYSFNLQPNYGSSSAAAPLPTEQFRVPAENNNNVIDFEYFNSFPPGYRFCPTEAELVLYYLKRKVNGQTLPKSKIIDVDLYQYNPDSLAEEFKKCGEKEWYFFTPRSKKYPNGKRPNRAAGEGYWKATGSDKDVMHEGEVVGFKRSLVFYIGKPPNGEKTNWIMYEFRVLDAPAPQRKDQYDMKLDDWVLCKIYHKGDKARIPVLRIPQIADEELVVKHEDTTDDQMVINDAAEYQHFNNNGTNFNQDIHINANYFFSDCNNFQQQQQQQQLSFDNFEPYIELANECASMNLHQDDPMLETSDFDSNSVDDWIILDNHKDMGSIQIQ